MSTAAALPAGMHAVAALTAQAEVKPPPVGFPYLPVFRVVFIAIAVVAAVVLLVSAVRTVTFRGTWKQNLDRGPAKALIGSIAILIVAAAAVTFLDWMAGPGL